MLSLRYIITTEPPTQEYHETESPMILKKLENGVEYTVKLLATNGVYEAVDIGITKPLGKVSKHY